MGIFDFLKKGGNPPQDQSTTVEPPVAGSSDLTPAVQDPPISDTVPSEDPLTQTPTQVDDPVIPTQSPTETPIEPDVSTPSPVDTTSEEPATSSSEPTVESPTADES